MKKIKITFDARMSEHSGIGTYIKNLLHEISKVPDVDMTLICKSKNSLKLARPFRTFYCDTDIYTIKEQFDLIKFFPKNSNEFFWSPHINIPLFYRGKNLIVTVHDLLFYEEDIFPQSIPKKIYRDVFFCALVKRAKIIFSPSNFTKNELNNKFSGTQKKSHAIHLGVGDEWKITSQASKKNKEIVFIGNIKKNKNLKLLVDAFDLIKNKIPHNLVIIGASQNLRSKEDLTKYNIDKNRVTIEGRLSDEELIRKVSDAELVVCPSLYEGFGLVPIEAYAACTKILCSDIPVHKETMGEFAEFFESSNVDSLAQKMIDVLSKNIDFKKEKFLKKYDWSRTASESLNVIGNI